MASHSGNGGVGSEANDKLGADGFPSLSTTNCFTVGERQEGCMIVPFFNLEALSRNSESSHHGSCAGPMVTKEFELLVERKR